ncbi:MAG: NUDIX domain-containing protein [Candidatus Dadabacteria bacterium]|nr:MAG: NUDIX domain-containing protein [Candidatus Dadabacteria bacterium]
MNELPYRPNVCMLIYNPEYRLFLGERYGEAGIWQFPQGGAEAELSLEENVKKEIKEELGLTDDKFRIVKKLNATNRYDWENPPEYARGKWRGQDQTFWLVEFSGADSDINVATESPEFMNWRWATLQEVRELAEPRRLKGYLKALNEYQLYVNSQKLKN